MTKTERSHEQQVDLTDQRLVAGRYRLLRRVGRGRLGPVYEAQDSEHPGLAVEKRVAIQLLYDKVTRSQALYNKLKLGYDALQTARHPNIVPFLDFDHDGKDGYLVMDFLEGVSLRFVLDDSETLLLDEVMPVIRAVGDALQFLHAKSIVHRQLSAENVFITEELDVRLLDVVPLNSAVSIPAGVASGDPFSRCDTTDDIYGLACLTYEMLAGTHPFNYHTLSEARHAGLRPARIDSLPEKQWNALRRALAFDDDQRTPSVAEFLREFGVEGTERLRPPSDAAGSSGRRADAAPLSPTTVTTPVARSDDALVRKEGRRSGWMRSVVLMIVLGGLGGWYFYGQPQDDVARMIDYVDSYLDSYADSPSSERVIVALPIEPDDVSPVASEDTKAQPEAEDGAQPEAEDEAQPGTEDVAQLGTEDVASSVVVVPATEEATAEPAESRPALARTSVQVFESDGAAQIASPFPDSAPGRIFWWTDDGTAIAENDFIPTKEPRVAFESGVQPEMLYIPLVDDSLPEPGETFYVYLGRYNAQLGRLETVGSIRVDIIDDD